MRAEARLRHISISRYQKRDRISTDLLFSVKLLRL